MQPSPNPKAVAAIQASDAVIYSIGSLYTSLAPSLILQGIGAAIANANGPRFKILILNGSLDRETGGFEGSDFIKAVVRCCDASISSSSSSPSSSSSSSSSIVNDDDTLKTRAKSYITHLIYIEHPSAPSVDRARLLADWGIEGVRLYGRKGADDDKMRYDEKALGQALGAILGRRDGRERSRRNTLEVG
ncbi:hypothetical protein XPA_000093 [Xanthoria parietina]